MKLSWSFKRVSLGDEMNMCGRPSGCMHRAIPDPRLSGKATPFRLLLGRDCRTQMDATSPSPDDEGMDRLRNRIANKSENLRQVQKFARTYNTAMSRDASDESITTQGSAAPRVKQGELVMVKEADLVLHNDCVHVKLTHERWTGPRTVTAVITPGLCYRATLKGRRERVRRATASHIKPHNLRPPVLRHNFGDEYAHFAWGPDLGLGAALTLASPLYTLVDHCTIQLPNGFWEWRYHGRYLNGALSGFITEGECSDSFSAAQLDVFHALWELYQPSRQRPRPAAKPTSSERLAANRTHALLEVPIGAVVWRDVTDRQGRIQRCRTKVYDYKTPYWRV